MTTPTQLSMSPTPPSAAGGLSSPVTVGGAFTPHRYENSADSQKYLDAQRAHFTAKCAETYRRLMAGERLTVLAAANSGISSLPRRVLDLRQQGVAISDERLPNGTKAYFLSPADLAFNRWHFDQQAVA